MPVTNASTGLNILISREKPHTLGTCKRNSVEISLQ